jgi:hypothetical protein
MRKAGDITRMGDVANTYTFFVSISERKRSLGRRRNSWGNNIKMHLIEIEFETMDWIRLLQNRDK